MADLNRTIRKKAESHFDYMVQTRRYLHKNPEISFKEFDTTDYIIHELKKLGIQAERPLETGCVGIIEGKKPGRVIALRADIDALAMEEEGDHKKEFTSERPGAAHCCGHDAHTANLLGTAQILSEMQDEIEGKIVLIFQPGEETLPGGGRLLSETGFLQKQGVQAIYGLHTNPNYKPGEIAVKAGPLMARPDEFEIILKGKGGHAATPHLTVDPIVMTGQVISQFQTIVSRSIDPTEQAVVTIGKIKAGTTFNVIPAKAELIGTVRTFSQENAYKIRDRMEAIVKGVTDGAGGSYDFNFKEGYPAVINDEELTRKVIGTAKAVLGDSSAIEMKKPIMAGEDFAFYQQHFPGTFFFLGSGSKEADSSWSWHHPRYNVDEKCFLTGASLMASLALNIEF
ncbi:MAG: amidohydrolase [Balneolaceae bacterium]